MDSSPSWVKPKAIKLVNAGSTLTKQLNKSKDWPVNFYFSELAL